ncbi:hypothetical protein CNY89_26680, partial [Amaricoccus sp. HAR-UPW-R2A-40]
EFQLSGYGQYGHFLTLLVIILTFRHSDFLRAAHVLRNTGFLRLFETRQEMPNRAQLGGVREGYRREMILVTMINRHFTSQDCIS